MHILLTGGGTGGHVVPNIALIEELLKNKKNAKISYVGQRGSIEEKLVQAANKSLNAKIDFYSIPAGKLRRYFSGHNFIDFFKVIAGFFKSCYLLIKLRPDVVFSKGGFVSLPVGIACFILGKKLIIHESDISAGLTTKILYRLADKVCLGFEKTLKYFPQNKEKFIFTGIPVRSSLLNGSTKKGLKLAGFKSDNKFTILIVGGSSGALAINNAVSEILPKLVKKFRIVHITGKNTAENIQPSTQPTGEKRTTTFSSPNYKRFEYLNEELSNIFAITDLVISRAGATAIAEFIKLNMPGLLIPLPKAGSRGDQIENANLLNRLGCYEIIMQEDLTSKTLLSKIEEIAGSKKIIDKQKKCLKNLNEQIGDSTKKIINLLYESAKK